MEVSLGNLSGWIPHLFLTDVPLKNPEKKFHRGTEIFSKRFIVFFYSQIVSFDLVDLWEKKHFFITCLEVYNKDTALA